MNKDFLKKLVRDNKILIIVGPTSSGKSELAVQLAKKYNGEIISCDSRQIYRQLNLGTGKVAGKWRMLKTDGHHNSARFCYKNVTHHLIDFVNPKKQYSVALFQKQAQKIIRLIQKAGHLPILCGGTGHWIDAVVFNQQIPNVKPNLRLRQQLIKNTAAALYQRLQTLDPARARTIDRHNKRRLVRALEIVLTTKKPVPPLQYSSPYKTLWLGIKLPQKKLFEKIDKRLKQRLRQGLVKEVKQLHQKGLSWKRLESFGLEYKYVSLFLKKNLGYQDMITQLSFAIKHYAKRQLTWFKKNPKIIWISKPSQATKAIYNFLK